MYSVHRIAYDGLGSWIRFIIFGVDNSTSCHTDNCKNDILVLGEGPTDDISGSIGASNKKFSINFSKAKAKFCLSLHYNGNNSYLFVNRKKMYKFKANNKMSTFDLHFVLEAYLISLTMLSQKKYL